MIPIVIDGFNKSFDKKGLRMVKKGTRLSVKFKAPLQIDYTASNDDIMETVMVAIEQSRLMQHAGVEV